MQTASIELAEHAVRIRDLIVTRTEVTDYLSTVPHDELEDALTRMLEVGAFCLQRASTTQDTEFVRRQINLLLHQVQIETSKIPNALQEELIKKIGTSDGQVLAPIRAEITNAVSLTDERVNQVRELLSKEIDPAKADSTLGRALRELRNLLDGGRNDSIQGRFQKAIQDVTTENGTLAKSVKQVVSDAVKPLVDQVDSLQSEIIRQRAQVEVLQETIEKGTDYENHVLEVLRSWGRVTGIGVEHVGPDGKAGDILITFESSSLTGIEHTIVVEVRNTSDRFGRKRLSDAMSEAMATRDAHAGIYVSKSTDGFAKEIGDWGEGSSERGRWVATTHNHLVTAVRFQIARLQLSEFQSSQPKVDTHAIAEQIKRIETSLRKTTNINRKVEDIRRSAIYIEGESRDLQREISDALWVTEMAIRAAVESADGSVPLTSSTNTELI